MAGAMPAAGLFTVRNAMPALFATAFRLNVIQVSPSRKPARSVQTLTVQVSVAGVPATVQLYESRLAPATRVMVALDQATNAGSQRKSAVGSQAAGVQVQGVGPQLHGPL